MFVPDPVPSGAQITKDVSFYSKVLLPALAALVPAAISFVFKWAQDHSRSRLRVELSDRMAALSKTIAEMPEVTIEGTTGGMSGAASPRAILGVELVSVSRELAALQAKVGHRVVFSATSRLRSALLLYQPHGVMAWTLHGIFYLYLIGFSMGMTAVLVNPRDPEFWYGILGFSILGIPPVIIRYFAARLHRAYCAKQSPAPAPPPPPPPPPPPVPIVIAAPAANA